MRTIAIVNQKGGCGKTTTAINVSGMLARRGLRVLLVDMDPQGHCAVGLGVPEARIEHDIGDAMLALDTKPLDPRRWLWRGGRNLDLAPARMRLAGLEAARGGLADKPDKERRLARVLETLASSYDVAIIDCSPSIGLLTFNALAAAHGVLIPVETSFFSLQGAQRQVNTTKSLGRKLGVTYRISLLPTIHDEESPLSRDLLEDLRRRFSGRVCPVVIRRDPALRESASFGKTIAEHAPESAGAEDYSALASWLMQSDLLNADVGAEAHEPDPEPIEVAVVQTRATEQGTPESERVLGDAAAARDMLLERVSSAVAVAQEAAPAVSRSEDLLRRAQRLSRREAEPAAGHSTLRVMAEAEPKPLPDPSRVAHLYGTRQTAAGVLFVQPMSLGRRVSIAGDFNGWSAEASPMRANTTLGVWELCLPLTRGRHAYRVVVDGQWMADPHHPWSEPNPFGEHNSVLDVG